MQHLIDLDNFNVDFWNDIIKLAIKIEKNPSKYYDTAKGKIMATLFYEPSTRTQMSFQTAMQLLGGRIIGFDNPSTTSVAKGESFTDTIRVVSGYADILVIRNPLEGSAKAAAAYSSCPVINAGDGGHLHPTQTLTDLVTLSKEKGTLEGMTIGLCGDLKNGRTVHSLIKAMCRYKGNKFVLISTPELAVPTYIKDYMSANNCQFEEVTSLLEAIPKLDVLYMTRIQKERFKSEEEYLSQKDVYVLDKEKMSHAKPNMVVLHPLPRVDEITREVDDDHRAVYFKQAQYGVYARMALILTLLDNKKPFNLFETKQNFVQKCTNEKCITTHETYLENYFTEQGDMLVCEYCEGRKLI